MRVIPLPWLLIGVLLTVGLSGALSYRAGVRHASDRIAAQEARDAATRQAIDKAIAEGISKIKVQRVEIHERVEKEIERVPAECVAPDSLHELANEAITGTKSTGGGIVPAADPDAG